MQQTAILFMYTIHSFDPEFIKLHKHNGSQSFYKRKYNDDAPTEKRDRFLLQIRKLKWMLRLMKFSQSIWG